MKEKHIKLDETQPISFIADLSIKTYINFIENIRLPAMVFNNKFELLGVNLNFSKSLKMSFDEVREQGIKNFFSSETWLQLQSPNDEALKSAYKTSSLVETEFEQNGRFFKLTLTPIKNTQSLVIGYLLFFIDMTREKMLEQSRADFTSMIVHDLRSPLTAIMGNMELLFMEFEETCDKDTRELFEDSLEQSQRLLNLINDLLDVSKIESGKFTLNFNLLNPNEVIKYSIRSMGPLAVRENITLDYSLESTGRHISADKDKLVQVLINLISNAIKFTPPAGLVYVSSKLVQDEKSKKEALLISVSDTGEGIKEKNLSKLFEKYKQVGKKKQRLIKGTGLGLFIVKELVEAHNGSIDVVSEFSKGSCFSLLFPLENE